MGKERDEGSPTWIQQKKAGKRGSVSVLSSPEKTSGDYTPVGATKAI